MTSLASTLIGDKAMGDIRRFATLHTKIKAMEALLLDKEVYKTLIEVEEPQEILGILKTTEAYVDVIEDVGLDLDKVERVMQKDLIEKYERLSYYFSDAYRKFYKTMFLRFEIETIKLFLRTFLRNEDVSILSEHVIYTKYSQLDFQVLSRVDSLESFIEGLKDTKYYHLLRYYLEEPSSKMMFYMEMSLDHYYFVSLYKAISNFSKEDRLLLEESIGKNVDLQNLQWIYRGLKYYNLSSEELLNYALDLGYHLKYKDLKNLCYTRDIDQLLDLIKSTKYGFLFQDESHREIFFELNMERYLLNLMVGLQKTHPMTILDTVVYLHRKEYEVRDIFTLLEAKRYHAPIGDVKKLLVHISE
jgi:V/A-type H+-transporting ATPase subunit C